MLNWFFFQEIIMVSFNDFSKAFGQFFLWASFEDKYLEKSVDVSKVTFLAV